MIKQIDGGYQVTHAPGAKLDYGFNWAAWLTNGEVLTGSTWVVDSVDITLTGSAFTNTVNVTFAQGGVAGVTYNLTCTITTSGGRTDKRSFILVCKQR